VRRMQTAVLPAGIAHSVLPSWYALSWSTPTDEMLTLASMLCSVASVVTFYGAIATSSEPIPPHRLGSNFSIGGTPPTNNKS